MTDSPSFLVALAGNPNTGKSTIFNSLTGLKQHTGNWAGKTVTHARGFFQHQNHVFELVDLPGTYSLLANSPDEEVARDFILFQKPDVTVVVTDGTCLERNLNLVLQVIELTPQTLLVVNLLDEARRKGLTINLQELAQELGIPVVGASARRGEGLSDIKHMILKLATRQLQPTPRPVTYSPVMEKAIARLIFLLEKITQGLMNPRWLSIRLLDGDWELFERLTKNLSGSLSDEQQAALGLIDQVRQGVSS